MVSKTLSSCKATVHGENGPGERGPASGVCIRMPTSQTWAANSKLPTARLGEVGKNRNRQRLLHTLLRIFACRLCAERPRGASQLPLDANAELLDSRWVQVTLKHPLLKSSAVVPVEQVYRDSQAQQHA